MDEILIANYFFSSRLAAQVREEDKSSYVAEWASKHAFGPPSPQGDHHGEQGDVDDVDLACMPLDRLLLKVTIMVSRMMLMLLFLLLLILQACHWTATSPG